MKFGQNLYLRSVPQWSYYNLDYNGLKDLIKTRTLDAPSEPVFIPGQGPSSSTWHSLEDELYPILREQHEKPGAFIKSKYGEIERRINDLGRRVEALEQSTTAGHAQQRVQQSRRYQRLVQDADILSEDVQALARFANTQRQGFRKILKKYEKWTQSPGLRIRVQKDLLQPQGDSLRPNLDPFLRRLAEVSVSIKQIPKPKTAQTTTNHSQPPTDKKPSAALLHEACQQKSLLEIGAAFASVPIGKHAGRATYWIHPDNLDEARALLLRHTKQVQRAKQPLSRVPSDLSGIQRTVAGDEGSLGTAAERQNLVLFDNVDRFAREQSSATISSSETTEGHVPTRIALSGWWSDAPEACVLTSDLSPATVSSKHECLVVRRKDLPLALSRGAGLSTSKKSSESPAMIAAQEYLAQHRDIKPLAHVQSCKTLYSGTTNSPEVGSWAALETNITMSAYDGTKIGQTSNVTGEIFPHAVLEIRWEFSPTPELVRVFDNSHVVERVRGFSLEAHTIFKICKPEMPSPLWVPLLDKDIRKVPLPSTRQGKRRGLKNSGNTSSLVITTSGPSSTEGPSDSVFTAGPSSTTSVTTPNPSSPDLTQPKKPLMAVPSLRKKKVTLPRKQPVVQRYWNEFDDGSEFEDDSYAIYVNPDEPMSFPGAQTVARVFSVVYDSMSKNKSRVLSLFSLQSTDGAESRLTGERQPLLRRPSSTSQDEESSTDSDLEIGKKGKARSQQDGLFDKRVAGQPGAPRLLGPRRQAREKALFRGYVGLLVLSYIFVVMAMILKATGRKKAALQVDAGVIAGVVAAEACGIIAMGLLCMRKRRTVTILHQVAAGLSFTVVAIAGSVLLVNVAIGRPS